MYSIETIIAMNDENSVKADAEKLQPYVAKCDGDEGVFKCPNFGYYRTEGWKEVGTYFVDNSGFGSDSEPAITPEKFLKSVKEGRGYAVIEAGQFQVHIVELEKL